MSGFFKKKGGGGGAGAPGSSAIHMTDSEAALAQSDFNTDKILEIQNKFTRGSTLLYPGRIFIREGVLWKVCRKGLKKRQFFLFNDILVYGLVVANRYSNQHVLPLSQMSVTSECFYQPRANTDFDEEFEQLELDVGNAFQICHADKSFHVFAHSSADKSNWVGNLQKHISRVASSLSGDQQLLTKPVWVPDSSCKECMTCKTKFTPFIRKHHCRQCGRVICSSCSPYRVALDPSNKAATSSGDKKMERICKDCFRDRSTHVVRRASSGNKPHPARPPPPTVTVAAKTVSGVVKSTVASDNVENHTLPDDHHDSSTDTEDSDDSDNEEELSREVTGGVVRHSTGGVVSHSTGGDVLNPPGAEPTQVPVTSQLGGGQVEESQPTPPPRKKKLKKKLEEVLANSVSSAKDRLEESTAKECGTTSTDQQPLATPIQQVDSDRRNSSGDTSPKKNRRRKKHGGHAEQAMQQPDEVILEAQTTTQDPTSKDTLPSLGDQTLPRDEQPLPPASGHVLVPEDQETHLPELVGRETLPPESDDQETCPPESEDQEHPPKLEDQEIGPPESEDQETCPPEHQNLENAASAGTDERKKRGRRSKFK